MVLSERARYIRNKTVCVLCISRVFIFAYVFQSHCDDPRETVYKSEPHGRKSFCGLCANGCGYGYVAHFGKVLAHGFARPQAACKYAYAAYVGVSAYGAVYGDNLAIGVVDAHLARYRNEVQRSHGANEIAVNGSRRFEQFAYNRSEAVAGHSVRAYAKKDRRSEQKRFKFGSYALCTVIIIKKYFKHGLNYDRVATIVYVKKNGGFKR